MASPFFEYRHIVGFQDTNLVGNVYYANHIAWQGRCREMFLRTHAPDTLQALQEGLALVTVKVSCEYLSELQPFDEVVIHMRLAEVKQNRALMRFEYFKQAGAQLMPIAVGEHAVAAMRREGDSLVPTPFPPSMKEALHAFLQ
ncbi:MAG: acyl-CoA thioesterase [Myxococcota bacterium]